MKSKFFYIFGGVLILALGIYFFSNYSSTETTTSVKDQQNSGQSFTDEAATTPQESGDLAISQTPKTDTNQSPGSDAHFSDESDIEGHDVQVEAVYYDGAHFTPSLINIKVGDIIFFKNNSDKPFWPASGPHPTHTLYSGFDAKEALQPGATFQFKFTKVGKWSYHDHLNDDATGTVNVTK